MFEGFATRDIPANGITIHTRMGGDGPPLLLLHGYPQTGAMWHAVAPGLARSYTVVVPDLRGYGASGKPPAGDGHANYSKRTMARDMVEVMAALGFDTFAVAGHDRGGRVAYRMAIDHPSAVRRLAVLDIVPTWEMWESWGRAAGLAGYHWTFLAQPGGLPERLIGADPRYFLHECLQRWAGKGFAFHPEAMAEYEAAFASPETVRATCDDYRAGATIDVEIDAEDARKRRITSPVLVLWGEAGVGRRRDGIIETWKAWAADVRGLPIQCGHFLPEEAPGPVLAALGEFFGAE
jgi:haloacetate dehalogenase